MHAHLWYKDYCNLRGAAFLGPYANDTSNSKHEDACLFATSRIFSAALYLDVPCRKHYHRMPPKRKPLFRATRSAARKQSSRMAWPLRASPTVLKRCLGGPADPRSYVSFASHLVHGVDSKLCSPLSSSAMTNRICAELARKRRVVSGNSEAKGSLVAGKKRLAFSVILKCLEHWHFELILAIPDWN